MQPRLARWALPPNPRRAPARANNFPRGGEGEETSNKTSRHENSREFALGPSPKPKTIPTVWAQGYANHAADIFLDDRNMAVTRCTSPKQSNLSKPAPITSPDLPFSFLFFFGQEFLLLDLTGLPRPNLDWNRQQLEQNTALLLKCCGLLRPSSSTKQPKQNEGY